MPFFLSIFTILRERNKKLEIHRYPDSEQLNIRYYTVGNT